MLKQPSHLIADHKPGLSGFIAILLCGVVLVFLPEEARYVTAPIFFTFSLTLWLWIFLWDRDSSVPLFDAGMLCALTIFIYTSYPLVNFWADGYRFGLLSDYRLWKYPISAQDIGKFHGRHCLYMASFVVTYAAFRGKGRLETGNIAPLTKLMNYVILAFFILLGGYFLTLFIITYKDISALKTYGAKTARVVEVMSSMPEVVAKTSDKLRNIFLLFKLSVLFIVVSRCRDRKWLYILVAWLSSEIVMTLVLRNTRTGLVFLILSAVLLYHRMIRPFSMRFLVTTGLIFFMFFNFLGLYRSYSNLNALQNKAETPEIAVLSGANEFQAIFATSYDVFQMKRDGVDLPWYLYINDFINILPPQQVVPFEKIRADEWYMRELGFSSDIGIGFMWGVVTQSIVGLDWLELFFRGTILGFILALIHRWYVKHQSGFIETMIYLYLCLRVYYTFRDTTFSLLTFFVWDIVPYYLMLRCGMLLLPRNNKRPPKETVPCGSV